MTVLIASTIASYKCTGGQDTMWLRNAELIADEAPVDVEWFVSIERDARGDKPFTDLLWRMDQLDDATVWRFSLDDGSDEVDTHNRLWRICAGRNAAIEYALRDRNITHILYLDTDTAAPNDCVAKLLELDCGVAAGKVPIYNLCGPLLNNTNPGESPTLVRWPRERDEHGHSDKTDEEAKLDAAYAAEQAFCHEHPYVLGAIPAGVEVREHWSTAGFLMVRRDVFSKIAWHYDPDAGNSDDPAYQAAAARLLGHTTRVRYDLIGQHADIPMVAIEDRGHDRRYRR